MRHHPIYLPQLTPVNKTLIIVLGSAFLLDSILVTTVGFSLKYLMGLQGPLFFSGHIYKLLSWPLVAGGLFEILFDSLILWFIGSELEMMWGRRRYIHFLLSAVLGGGLFFLGVAWMTGYGVLLSGMGGVASAICVAFGILFPHRIMFFLFFPLKAKYLVMILVGMNLYQGLFSPGKALAWGILGSCLGAFLWILGRRGIWLRWIQEKFPVRKKKRRHLRLFDDKIEDKDEQDITYH